MKALIRPTALPSDFRVKFFRHDLQTDLALRNSARPLNFTDFLATYPILRLNTYTITYKKYHRR